MLAPAAAYKQEMLDKFKEYYYTDDMMYETGCMCNWSPEIADNPDESTFQYAILSAQNDVIGYLAFHVDWYSSGAYNFGVISFHRGNPNVGRDIYDKMTELLERYKLHRIEWRMVSGNPIEKHYDKFCEKYHGRKLELKDTFKDRLGQYRSCFIYEIIQ